jgi:hypothetical protein
MRTALVACLLALGMVPAGTTSGRATAMAGFIVYVHTWPRNPYPVGLWVVLDESMWTVRRLPFGREHTTSPHWSADGRRLLFQRESGVYSSTYAPTLLPGPSFLRPRRVARLSDVDSVDWSPDGTSIALAMSPRHRERRFCTDLYTMRSDATRLRRLTATPACELNPAWSPDGLRIAFEKESLAKTEIVATDTRGRDGHVLGEGTFPAWSPDGRSLAFLAEETIQIVDSSTGALLRSLRPDLEYDRLQDGLAWSPDGKRLVHGFRDLQETKPVTHLAVIDVDGTDSFQVTPKDTFPDMEPDWQPICTVYGTDGDDVLVGTPEDDLICGLRGDDVIRGGPGDDTILAGDGNDSIHGGEGSDRLFGAAGDDRLYALDAQPDIVNGGPGRDRMWGDQDDTVTEVEERRG